jgi:hypothetical protein
MRKSFLLAGLVSLVFSASAFAQSNTATVVQLGGVNSSLIAQSGARNTATAVQIGARNSSAIFQRGRVNNATVGQAGNVNRSLIVQTGFHGHHHHR